MAVATREFIARMMRLELQIERNVENLRNTEGPQDPDPDTLLYSACSTGFNLCSPRQTFFISMGEGYGSCPPQEYIGLWSKRRVHYDRKT